jgi:hypothetical protein
VGPPQQRLVLAALAVDADRPVTIESLIDRVWDETPANARHSLYVLIAGIRRMLRRPDATDPAPAAVVRQAGGYVLHADPDRVDVLRFRRLIARAREPACSPQERVELLRGALGLWRGEPLSGVPGGWAARTRQAVAGTAGVGKSALAIHSGHRVRDRFPDGQLYVNLRGYDPDRPVPAADAHPRRPSPPEQTLTPDRDELLERRPHLTPHLPHSYKATDPPERCTDAPGHGLIRWGHKRRTGQPGRATGGRSAKMVTRTPTGANGRR